MRFLSIYKAVETNVPPSSEHMAKMEKLIEESMRRGELLATEGCLPSAFGSRVRLSREGVTVTDGPFSEAKEVVGGFAILYANSKAEAVEMAKKFLAVVGEGECEIRQLFESSDCASGDVAAHREKLTEQFAGN